MIHVFIMTLSLIPLILKTKTLKEMTSTLSEYKIVSFIIENIEDMEDLIYYFKMKYDITISKIRLRNRTSN